VYHPRVPLSPRSWVLTVACTAQAPGRPCPPRRRASRSDPSIWSSRRIRFHGGAGGGMFVSEIRIGVGGADRGGQHGPKPTDARASRPSSRRPDRPGEGRQGSVIADMAEWPKMMRSTILSGQEAGAVGLGRKRPGARRPRGDRMHRARPLVAAIVCMLALGTARRWKRSDRARFAQDGRHAITRRRNPARPGTVGRCA
jgi:hypothetical protein